VQVYGLSLADLERFPVWEFAFDEEGEPGQDEATVKPRPHLADGVDPDEGLFVVEPKPEVIEKSYKALGGQRDGLFPLSFRTSVPVAGAPMEGKVPAFMYQDDSGEPRAAG
jgi:hypothetical protein